MTREVNENKMLKDQNSQKIKPYKMDVLNCYKNKYKVTFF